MLLWDGSEAELCLHRPKIDPGHQPILRVFWPGVMGMIPMTMIGKARRMFHRQNKSVREFARLTSPVAQYDSQVSEGRCCGSNYLAGSVHALSS
jgi:hypothetical protein